MGSSFERLAFVAFVVICSQFLSNIGLKTIQLEFPNKAKVGSKVQYRLCSAQSRM